MKKIKTLIGQFFLRIFESILFIISFSISTFLFFLLGTLVGIVSIPVYIFINKGVLKLLKNKIITERYKKLISKNENINK